MSINHQFYITVRPISDDFSKIERYIEPVKDITGLDEIIIRQKLKSISLQVLKIYNDQRIAEDISNRLKIEGVPSVVIGREELKGQKQPLRASVIETDTEHLRFINREGKAIFSINKTDRYLIVVSTTEISGLIAKRISSITQNRHFPVKESLKYIFLHHPIMDIYSQSSENPVRIDGNRFNYTGLGKDNKQAVALNFPFIIILIN